jgi:hypothetical protein
MQLADKYIGSFDFAQGRLFTAKSAAQDDTTWDYS